MTLYHANLARFEAVPGKAEELAAFFVHARDLAAAEGGTVSWYAFRISENSFGIFDTFETVEARQAHELGQVPAAFAAGAAHLVAGPPDIRPVDIIAVK